MKLKEWINDSGATQASIARTLGISRAHMSAITNGVQPPGSELMRKIELLTEGAVTLSDWYPEVTIATPETPEEQAHG